MFAPTASVFCVIFWLAAVPTGRPPQLPADFVYLRDVAPGIEQEMRYAGPHNFTGAQVPGYGAPICILTDVTARALAQAQAELNVFGLGLKVYDCYRPKRAVAHFSRWAASAAEPVMAAEFFPTIAKGRLHGLGYIAHRSGHSRGSTVDLTLVPYPHVPSALYQAGEPLRACTAPYKRRFADNSLDMGTGFDCLDPSAHTECPTISTEGRRNRLLLRQVMRRYGLINYPKEWWHFTYYNEPHKNMEFDAPVSAGG